MSGKQPDDADAGRALEVDAKLRNRLETFVQAGAAAQSAVDQLTQPTEAGRKLPQCTCGRDAQGGPYPRVHAKDCAYVQPARERAMSSRAVQAAVDRIIEAQTGWDRKNPTSAIVRMLEDLEQILAGPRNSNGELSYAYCTGIAIGVVKGELLPLARQLLEESQRSRRAP